VAARIHNHAFPALLNPSKAHKKFGSFADGRFYCKGALMLTHDLARKA